MSRFGEDERATVLNPSKQRLVIAIVDDFMEMVSLNIVCVIHIHFWGTVSARIAALRVFDRMAWMVVARVESTAGCGVSARTGGFVVALAPWDGYSCWRMRSARGWCVFAFPRACSVEMQACPNFHRTRASFQRKSSMFSASRLAG